jgi:hypothetical protein
MAAIPFKDDLNSPWPPSGAVRFMARAITLLAYTKV